MSQKVIVEAAVEIAESVLCFIPKQDVIPVWTLRDTREWLTGKWNSHDMRNTAQGCASAAREYDKSKPYATCGDVTWDYNVAFYGRGSGTVGDPGASRVVRCHSIVHATHAAACAAFAASASSAHEASENAMAVARHAAAAAGAFAAAIETYPVSSAMQANTAQDLKNADIVRKHVPYQIVAKLRR